MIMSPINRIPLQPDQGGDKTCQAELDVAVVEVKLTEVSFGGTGIHVMKKTGSGSPGADWENDLFGVEGDTIIANPVWVDSNADGTLEENEPIAYTRGSKPTITEVKLSISPPLTSTINAKLKVESVSGALKFQVKDVSLMGNSIIVSGVSTTDTVGDAVDNFVYDLRWSISFDGGASFNEFAASKHTTFVTLDTPSGFLANPGVTAKRVDHVTTIAVSESDRVEIAKKISDDVRSRVGFDLQKFIFDTTGNHWELLDQGIACDCISLAVLAAKQLRMLGVEAIQGRAFPTGAKPPGDTNAGDSEKDIIGGVPVELGFFAAGGFNRFEGFFEIKDGNKRKAFTVDPVQGPIEETTLPAAGDKLKYNVMKVTLDNIGAKQFWFKQSDFTRLDPNDPIPFPVP